MINVGKLKTAGIWLALLHFTLAAPMGLGATVEGAAEDFEILDLTTEQVLEIDEQGLKAWLEKERQKGWLGAVRAFFLSQAPLDVFASYQLIDNALEGGTPGEEESVIKEIAGKFNPVRIGLNGHRAYHIYGRDARVGQFISGLIATKLLTHSLETTALAWGNGLGAMADVGPVGHSMISLFSIGMALPLEFISVYMFKKIGLPINPLEPFCAIGGALYMYVSPVRKLVRVSTWAAEHTALPLGRFALRILMRDIDRITYITHQLQTGKTGKFKYPPTLEKYGPDNITMFFRKDADSPLVDLKFSRSGPDELWQLDTIVVDESQQAELKELIKDPSLKLLNWTTRDLIKQVLLAAGNPKAWEALPKRYYVESVDAQATRTQVHLKPRAAQLTPHRESRLRKKCDYSALL